MESKGSVNVYERCPSLAPWHMKPHTQPGCRVELMALTLKNVMRHRWMNDHRHGFRLENGTVMGRKQKRAYSHVFPVDDYPRDMSGVD